MGAVIRITRRRGGGEGFGRGGTPAELRHANMQNGPPRLELGRLFASTRVICRWDGGIGAFIGGSDSQSFCGTARTQYVFGAILTHMSIGLYKILVPRQLARLVTDLARLDSVRFNFFTT